MNPWGCVCVDVCVCVCVSRGIELPLHDNGMEPVEFLKSMGISLTPLNDGATVATRAQGVSWGDGLPSAA